MSVSMLPEPIIQRVQYFLSSTEAARTTVLSKSWRSAWLTRPNLDFDHETGFACSRESADPFSKFVEKTFTRYEDSNLTVESFRLCVERYWSYTKPNSIRNLIVRALEFGVTRLSFRVNTWRFLLPNEVFAYENIVALTVSGCMIYLGPNQVVRLSLLQYLSLEEVKITSHDVLFRIISSCPLIEKLSLCEVIECGQIAGYRDVVGDALPTLHRLRSLVLDHAYFDTPFLAYSSSKFPSLKDLTLCMTSIGHIQEDILISSHSLECLNFKIKRCACGVSNPSQWVKFDVPSIRKLTFEASAIPSTCIMRWESDVSITHHRKSLSANNIDYLGETFLQGLDVRISSLSQLMYGLNDLKEARAQIFDEADSTWRDVPLLDNSTIPKAEQSVRFQLIWQPKQKIN